jgi:hypothetical protein
MTTKILTRKQFESAYMKRLTYMHAARIIDNITKTFMPEKIKNYPVLNKITNSENSLYVKGSSWLRKSKLRKQADVLLRKYRDGLIVQKTRLNEDAKKKKSVILRTSIKCIVPREKYLLGVLNSNLP